MSQLQFRSILETSGVDLTGSSDFKVAEIGQGSGTLLKTLGHALDTSELYAYDTDRWANYRSKQRGINILHENWVSKDDTKLESQNKVFDIVCLFNVLDRAGAPCTMLEDALAIAKPGGTILVSVSVPWRPSPTGSYKVTSGHAMITVNISHKQFHKFQKNNLVQIRRRQK